MAFDMHIKFKGGGVAIEGSSGHAKHKGEIPVLAWSWGARETLNNSP
ncbi:type VI secretion system tube protein Hcp [Xanthomonas cassavae]